MSQTLDGPDAERWRDLTLERAVLGAVLLFPEISDRYLEAGLTPTLFSLPAHVAIWRAAAELAAEGSRPDFPLLRLRLQDHGELEEVGVPYLAQLLDDGLRPDPANIPAHVSALGTLTRCRRAFYGSITLREALTADPDAINNGLLAKFVATVDEVPAGRTDTPTWLEAGPVFAHHADAPLPPMLVEGLIPGDGLTLLHADPRSLQSWIALEVALALASGTPALGTLGTAGPVPVLYLSNEDGRQRTSDRLLKLARGPRLLAAIRERETRRAAGVLERDRLADVPAVALDAAEIRRRLRAKMAECRTLLTGDVMGARRLLELLLDGYITFMPAKNRHGFDAYRVRIPLRLDRVFETVVCQDVWRPRRDSNPCFSLERAVS